MPPKVCIVITTKNRLELLKRALRSAINQTYPSIEVIIVDDGSSDETPYYLKQLEREGKLVAVINQKSLGACKSRNHATKISNAKLITYLDDDDFFTADRIEKLVTAYNETYSFVCDSHGIYSKGKIRIYSSPSKLITLQDIKIQNYSGIQVFTEREKIIKIGGFDESLDAWQDYDLKLRLIETFGPGFRLEGCSYIVDQESELTRISTSSKAYQGYLQFMKKHHNSLSYYEANCQSINDLYNRKVKIGIIKVIQHTKSISNLKRLASLYLLSRFPNFYNKTVSLLVKVHERQYKH
ncbi:Glycosyltransferase involved in cell wall biogenesis [Hahella chejuensis KCTC 2396]|uniref:Glycosyltransferase involved in cell wall biogenesis n=1 Tax=Hahella chejuensis (strain KCTC 2396) TaxID=349521 RepID=Q2SBM9_HAHCH|nr:glycosyltransferase [Hahella chejuensis]ABC31945.1 Glycosyltransferase involved in cell wall biogenesis [Hahella chejuensis KCTC 2396]